MQQRIGLAMALLHRPQIVFLDEPTSGLDPFGRLLVRDVIRAARDEGTTVFLNSHLLGEVEQICDRVAFIRQGKVLKAGTLEELSAGLLKVRLKLGEVSAKLLMDLVEWGGDAEQIGAHEVNVSLQSEDQLPDLTAWLVGQGVKVYAVMPHQLTLEELFLDIMGGASAEEMIS
jgi:ABC-2 type transport system ATP-binding protein